MELTQHLKDTDFFTDMFGMGINFSDEYLQSYLLIILCSISRVDGEEIFDAFAHALLFLRNPTQLTSEVLRVLFLSLQSCQ